MGRGNIPKGRFRSGHWRPCPGDPFRTMAMALRRDWLHVRDFASGVCMALETWRRGAGTLPMVRFVDLEMDMPSDVVVGVTDRETEGTTGAGRSLSFGRP